VPWRVADDDLTRVHGLDRGHELPRRQGLGQVAAGAQALGLADQVGMEVPGVDRDATGVGVLDQHLDLGLVGLGLRERVIQDNVDLVLDSTSGVQLRDDDAVAVGIQHVRHADHHHVVVIDQGDVHGRLRGRHHPP
jgi:hypothetical protein